MLPAELPPSDGSLLLQFRQGDSAAGDELCARYVGRLTTLARANLSTQLAGRIDAEDIVQSVFRRFFQAVERGRYDVPRGADLWSLLMVIALNRVRGETRFQRSARRSVDKTCDLSRAEQTAAAESGNPPADFLVRLMLREALGQLPAHYQQVIQLRIENYDVAEIARQTGRSKRTAERILQDARRQLDALLDGGATAEDGPHG